MKIKLDMTHYDGRRACYGTGWAVEVKLHNSEWEKLGKPTTIEVEINVP